jgi:hypothetical protein
MEDAGIRYGHLVYFVAIWSILCLFGIFFYRFGMLHGEKSGNPAHDEATTKTKKRFFFVRAK